MKNILIKIFLMTALTASCNLTAQEQTPTSKTTPSVQPKRVSVQIINATIGPCKVDGSKWSGFGKVNSSVTTNLAQVLLKDDPYTAVIGFLSSSAISGLDKPEPFGMVDVAVNGQYIPKLEAWLFRSGTKGLERTYTPIFDLPAYQNVPLEEGTRFKVTLYSKNRIVPKPSPIGVVVINSKDLQKALDEEKIYQVPVADQTQNQILFVGIEVNLVTTAPKN